MGPPPRSHDAAGDMQRFTLYGMRDLCPQWQFGHAINIERPKNGGGGGTFWHAVIDGMHQHGNAKRIRQQDEFLALAITHMPVVLLAAASRILNNTQADSGNARKRPSQSLTKLA